MVYSPDYYKNQFEAAIKLAAKHAEECMRLRAALEKYANYGNWYNSNAGVHEFCPEDGVNSLLVDEPWTIAQEALKDAPQENS